MARNNGDGSSRKGQVKNRSQTYNPKTGQYVKRGEGGKFVSCKKGDGPYKGIRKEGGAKIASKVEVKVPKKPAQKPKK